MTASHGDEVDTLLYVAVKGLAPVEEVATKLPPDARESTLHSLVEAGVLDDDSGYLHLTEQGSRVLNQTLQQSLREDDRSELEDFHRTFEALDLELKAAATKWQTHRADGDAEVMVSAVGQWYSVHTRLTEAIDKSPVASRILRGTDSALSAARQKFADGDRSAFTGVEDDSYHCVWFVMHELLLRSLGLERTS